MTKFIKANDVNNLYEVRWDATKALLSKSKLEAFTWGLKMAIEEFRKLPTVEAEPVRQGEWIECEGRDNEYYCSECYDIWKSDRIKGMKYCPSCGAKMDAKEQLSLEESDQLEDLSEELLRAEEILGNLAEELGKVLSEFAERVANACDEYLKSEDQDDKKVD